jgi:hypothetical protein
VFFFISRLFRLVFLAETVFFFLKKSARTVLQLQRTGPKTKAGKEMVDASCQGN